MRIYDAATGQWREAPNPTQQSAPGGVSLLGGTYVRGNDPGQSVEARMNGLLRSGSDLMRTAAKAGETHRARTGLLNSGLAIQSAQQGAATAALPIATADAQIAAQAASQNADALNAMAIANAQRNAQTAGAGGGAVVINNALTDEAAEARQMRLMRLASELNISEAEAGRIFDREQSQAERDWRSGEAGAERGLTREGWNFEAGQADIDRGWRSGESAAERDARIAEAERDRGLTREGWRRDDSNTVRDQRTTLFRDVLGQAFTTLFSSPELWRDQAGAQGFLSFFTGENFRSMLDQFFGGAAPAPAPGGG